MLAILTIISMKNLTKITRITSFKRKYLNSLVIFHSRRFSESFNVQGIGRLVVENPLTGVATSFTGITCMMLTAHPFNSRTSALRYYSELRIVGLTTQFDQGL